MKDTDAAWAAGFLDGEGTFSIEYSTASQKFVSRISAGQNDPKPLLKLQELFGGSIYPYDSDHKGRHAKRYIWALSGREVTPALQAISLYLTVKARQSVVLLKFRTMIEAFDLRGIPLTDDEFTARFLLHLEMQDLHAEFKYIDPKSESPNALLEGE